MISKFPTTNELKWVGTKRFDLNKYTSNSSKECFSEVDFEYPKKLHKLHNDYLLDPDKIEIKNKMLYPFSFEIFLKS